ncbi:hypothetical protein E2562_011500 [Oryza meyeriana var. granulata]|uniref:DUF295 domain-containing protein n=1 Tax=Oryza meyeriana var. granulata TaxID=110450 RepID=A0A6G1D1F6_9ORYZ|nr:hypothetical protein E2562_011500 [Oryza meyeriana var. granulata]
MRTNVLGAMDERFTVFEVDFGSSRWAEVRTVGDDRALFLGRWFSRANEEWADRVFFLEDGAGDEWLLVMIRNQRKEKLQLIFELVIKFKRRKRVHLKLHTTQRRRKATGERARLVAVDRQLPGGVYTPGQNYNIAPEAKF